MKIHKEILGVVFLIFCSGCFWPFGGSSTPRAMVEPQVSVQVLSDEALRNGGEIVFVPFVAGPGAEAGAAVDRVALQIVQGASEALGASASGLRVASGDDLTAADFILDGRVEDFIDVMKWKGLGYGRSQIKIKIKGELRDQRTNEVVALIFGSRIVKHKGDVDQAAYDIGRAIGEELIR